MLNMGLMTQLFAKGCSEFLIFVTIGDFQFCHNLDVFVLLHFDSFSFVTILVYDFFSYNFIYFYILVTVRFFLLFLTLIFFFVTI